MKMLGVGFAIFGLGALIGGCSSNDSGTGTTPDGGISADSAPPVADAGAPGDASSPSDSSPPAATANVRVAHLSPDAPAVDFCLALHGSSTFQGPVLKGAGVAAGLSFASVTKYLAVPAAQYDVRLVAPGATDCTKSLAGLPDFTNLPALSSGASATIAAEGEVASGGVPFGLKAYVDDGSVSSGKAKLRFVHASPATPAVDVGVGGGVLFTPVFSNVAFGAAGMGDANGYAEVDPLAGVELSARAHGSTSDAIAIKPATLPAGAIATAFAVGKIGDTKAPLKVLLCVDNAPPSGAQSACSLVGAAPQRAHVRVAHLSPDAPAVDVCLAASGATFTGKPLLGALGAMGGLSFPQVTTYVDLPVQTYDVRIVAASATDCTTGVFDKKGIAVTDGLSATIAALGDLTVAGSDPAFDLGVLVDDAIAPTGGNISLRFVHASPGTPAVDVGLGSGSMFTKVFANVAFGHVASGTGIDPNGYATAPALTNQTVSARLANASSDALVVPGVNVPAGAIATAFAVGGKTGDSVHPLKVLLCNDDAAPSGLLASCATAP